MGAYLSKPITKKETEVGEGNNLEYAASCMQGWRVSQEDAHNCITDLDDKSSLFAVYDGHGGAEVAIYLARRYPEVLKSSDSYKEGNWEKALSESYLKIDAQIKEPETIKEIQKIAKKDAGDDTDNIADYEEENVGELYEEATMPLEKLLKKYNAARAGLMKEFTTGSSDPDAPQPGSSKSLISSALAASSCSSSSTSGSSQTLPSSSSSSSNLTATSSAAVAGGSSSSNIQEEQMTSSSSTSGEGSSSKETNKITQEIETEAVAAGDECSSSSGSSKKPIIKNITTTNEIDTTAEAEISASGSSPKSEMIPKTNNNNNGSSQNNGDVEPSSSTSSSSNNNNNKNSNLINKNNSSNNNAIDDDDTSNEAAAASIPRRSINGTDENVEPDSTENEAISANVSGSVHQNGGEDDNSSTGVVGCSSVSAGGSSSSTTTDSTTTTTAATSTNTNGGNNTPTEGVADSTQSENIVKISIESPKRKGKIHPVPVAPLPQSTRTSSRKKVDDSKVYKNFINEESASSESDEDMGGVQPFMHDSDSDEDEDESAGKVLGNSSSSDDDDDAEEEEDGDEDDDEDDDEEDDDDEDEEDHRLISDMQEPGYDSGSTAVVAFMRWEGDKLGLWVANAGDSRCVVCRNGTALEMSHDHKPEEDIEARRIIRAGGKVTADGRVNGGLNLSRAIGDHSYKQNTTLPAEDQMITPVPDIRHEILDPLTDQFVVLACDGVWNSLSSQEVVDFVSERLKSNVQIPDIIEQLFDACLAFDTTGDGTGCDNMTAIIVKLPTKKPDKKEEIKIESTMDQESIKTEDTDSSSSKRRLSTDENEVEVDSSKRLKTTSD